MKSPQERGASKEGTTVGNGVVRVGTSGWQYDDWRGAFYPDHVPKRLWFEYYATRFPTVEINATFYRLPRTSTVQRWHDRAPDRFRFAAKGSRYLTHNKKLADPHDPIDTVITRLAPLKTFQGVWLWQLPPNLHVDVERLEVFAAALPGSQRHAVEFRHDSWYTDEIERTLARHGIAWVWLSVHQMPDASPITADFVYLRFHGLSDDDEQRYRYDYSEDELSVWADRLRAAAADGCDAWVYFNNDYDAHAPRNATTLIEMLDDTALRWP